jgi:hypothetical protein
LAGYVYRIAKVTGWGWREITEELPFSAGLQLIFCDDAAQGRRRRWTSNNKAGDVDALAMLEEAFAKVQI